MQWLPIMLALEAHVPTLKLERCFFVRRLDEFMVGISPCHETMSITFPWLLVCIFVVCDFLFFIFVQLVMIRAGKVFWIPPMGFWFARFQGTVLIDGSYHLKKRKQIRWVKSFPLFFLLHELGTTMPFVSQVDFSHGWDLLLDKIYSFSKNGNKVYTYFLKWSVTVLYGFF